MTGERRGGYVVLRDRDGLRHAVRPNSIGGLHEVDQDGTETAVQIGGRAFVVAADLDTLLDLVDGAGSPSRPRS